MVLDDDELWGTSEGALLKFTVAYYELRHEGEGAMKVLPPLLGLTPETLTHAMHNRTNIGGRRWALLQRIVGVNWFDRWYQLQREHPWEDTK